MKAQLLPLEGKYYGTEVEIEIGKRHTYVNFWVPFGEPSWREWSAANADRDAIDFSHYESEHSLKLAQIFVDAVNNYKEPLE